MVPRRQRTDDAFGYGEVVFAANDDLFPDNTGNFVVSYECRPGWGHGDDNHLHWARRRPSRKIRRVAREPKTAPRPISREPSPHTRPR